MEIVKGYNKINGSEYEHNPNSEKIMFYELIQDYISKNNTLENINGIEIGVLNGETSSFFLNIDSKINLVGIDPLIPDSMEKSLIGSLDIIKENTKNNKDRFIFINDYSFNVANNFEDEKVDFLFIDGDHTYPAVEKDYNLYYSKVKHGGLIFLHDSRMFRGGANFHVGSSEFCDYLIKTKKIELIGEAFSLTAFKK